MIITRVSELTGKRHALEIEVTLEELKVWHEGEILLQNAFPNLTPDEREFIKTGITAEEWESMYGNK